ncbi:hypothetical protein ACFL2V_05440 [Pseudomonadota bacterium]
MPEKLDIGSCRNSKEQESLMHDVLEGLEEVVTMLSYDPWPGDFEIVAVYPPDNENKTLREETVVKSVSTERTRGQIISYEELKELKLQLSA